MKKILAKFQERIDQFREGLLIVGVFGFISLIIILLVFDERKKTAGVT